MEIGESISAFEINKTFYFKNSKQHSMQIVIAKTVSFKYAKLFYCSITNTVKTKSKDVIKNAVKSFNQGPGDKSRGINPTGGNKIIKIQSVREYLLLVQSVELFTKPTLTSSN